MIGSQLHAIIRHGFKNREILAHTSLQNSNKQIGAQHRFLFLDHQVHLVVDVHRILNRFF
ncbi:hypothetical protein D3C85_1197330 [compost metagenome]